MPDALTLFNYLLHCALGNHRNLKLLQIVIVVDEQQTNCEPRFCVRALQSVTRLIKEIVIALNEEKSLRTDKKRLREKALHFKLQVKLCHHSTDSHCFQNGWPMR